jgi:CRP-like cAMP-binding protein
MEQDYKESLQRAALFKGITNEDYEKLIDCLSPRIKHYAKNEILLLTGQSVSNIGIVLKGSAVAFLEHIDGNRTIMSNLGPQSVFGEILVSTGTQKSPITLYAVTDLTAAYIEYQKTYNMCAKVCDAHRVLLQNMMKTIGDKYFSLFERINILREKTLRDRIMAYLHTQEGKGTIHLPYTKTILADYLLANRSSLSRELHKMASEGIIAIKGREITLK